MVLMGIENTSKGIRVVKYEVVKNFHLRGLSTVGEWLIDDEDEDPVLTILQLYRGDFDAVY